MVKLVDALASGASGRKALEVRVLFRAQYGHLLLVFSLWQFRSIIIFPFS